MDPGTAPHPIPRVGELVAGKFRVERVLGEGGMGVVLQVRHLQLASRAALKFLRPEVAARASMAGRFLREAKAAANLRSEHVARVVDMGTLESGAPFLVMEYLEGTDLRAVLEQRGRLPVAEAVEYVLQACDALAEAHRLGLVHRDVKPANLFLTRRADGSPLVKVLDFGIAKALDEADGDLRGSLTSTDAAVGSTIYMAPEQVRSAKDVDARADVWAIGVVLHELVTGTPPFGGETASAVCAAIVADPPASLVDKLPEAPPGLDAVILRCLDKDMTRRYRDLDEVARALRPFAPGERPAPVEPVVRDDDDDTPPSPSPPRRSIPTAFVVAGVVAGALAASAVFALVRSPSAATVVPPVPAVSAASAVSAVPATVIAPPAATGEAPAPVPAVASTTPPAVAPAPRATATSSPVSRAPSPSAHAAPARASAPAPTPTEYDPLADPRRH
jgi:serine/threonine-protein kinase